MNRFMTLAIGLILTLPAATQAQVSLEDLTKAHAKTSRGSQESVFDVVSRWLAYNRAGWRAINKGYFDTAEHEFQAAIDVVKPTALRDKDYGLLARSYADYAWAIQKQGRHAEAEPLLKWALVVREAQLTAESPAIAQTLNQLGTLYYEVGRFEEAEPILKRAVALQGLAEKPNTVEHSRSHTLLGLLLVTQRRYAEAEAPFVEALKIRETSRGASHPDTGDSASNLAWAYHQQGKDDQARPLFERSLKIFEQARGKSDPSVAHTLHGLAKIQSNEGEQDQAEARFLRAIAIWDKQPILDAPALTEVLKDYASLLEKLGRAEDLVKIKARLSPLKAKVTLNVDKKAGPWYRWPEPAADLDLGTRRARS